MRADRARAVAKSWVATAAVIYPGFRGALWHGSILTLPDDAELPLSSDLDIVIVVDDPDAVSPPGKVWRDGVLLDISHVGWDAVRDPEELLANHSLAPTFRNPELLADPTCELTTIASRVRSGFASRGAVERRCASAVARLERNLASLSPARPFHENVMAWLFGTGITTHVLLVAGLRNPTVRKRYLATRELLDDVEMSSEYAWLLDLLGCRHWTRSVAITHLDALSVAFDAAGEAIQTPVFFANDLSADARTVAIGGSRELIEAGDHREAVFWIAATWARCMSVFHIDAPALAEQFDPGFHALLADLGVADLADLQRRAGEVTAGLPRLRRVASAVMDETPEIER